MGLLTDVSLAANAIPAPVWGIIGTLAGAGLTNWASNRRLRRQLQYEREEKKREREMALRKEVYMAAADAVSAGINCIPRLTNLEIPTDQITATYAQKVSAIARVYVIAQAETIQALSSFTGEFEAAFLKLAARRHALILEQNEIKFLDEQLAGFEKDRAHILELMKQHNIDGVRDQRRWDVLKGNFDFEHKRIIETQDRKSTMVQNLVPKEFDFIKDAVAEAVDLKQSLISTLVAIRKELEIPLDENAYCKIIDNEITKQKKSMNDFVQKFMPSNAPQPAQK